MLGAATGSADDLGALKAAARGYVLAMKAVIALPEKVDCSETIAKAGEYAAAKIAYYDAARRAMPALLQIAKGQNGGSSSGGELTEIFRNFGEDRDKQATGILDNKLNLCPASEHWSQARTAIDHARQIADQFIKDFGALEGV